MSKLFYLSMIFFIIWPASSYSALIMRVKNKKALIHLQGVKTQKGAYFKVYDLNNKKTGLLKIDRVAETKAIGTLKTGAMSRKWNLEPVSKRTALVELKKAIEKKEKLALIQKEKMKRRIAHQKRAYERKRRLAKQEALERQRQRLERQRLAAKKKSLKRKIASFSLEEDVLEGLEVEDEMEQSEEVLSYSNPSYNEVEDNSFEENSDYPEMEVRKIKRNKRQASYFDFGLNLNPQFNYMKISPQNKNIPSYYMTGLGGSAHLHSLFSYNSFLEIGGMLGYRYFSASTPEGNCPRDEGCSLLVHYLSAMGHFKFNVLNFNQNKLWFLTEGSLMLPLAYLNRVPNLKQDSFSSMSLHGTIGAGLGIDFKVGSWVIPVSINGSLHMPLSQTTLLLTGGLQTGFRYQF